VVLLIWTQATRKGLFHECTSSVPHQGPQRELGVAGCPSHTITMIRSRRVGWEGTAEPRLVTLLALTRSELDRVDHKADVLFTGSGVITGAIVAGALAGQWSPTALSMFARIAWWVGVVAWIASLGSLAAAVFPRLGPDQRRDRTPMIAYFLDVARLGTSEELLTAVRQQPVPPAAVLIDQLFRVSKLVRAKYRCLQAALWLLLLAVACGAVAVILPQ
jgi:pycsar effector protein